MAEVGGSIPSGITISRPVAQLVRAPALQAGCPRFESGRAYQSHSQWAMIPIYQTVIDTEIGNCFQAAVASLLELPLDEVPHFIVEPGWPLNFHHFLEERGLEHSGSAFSGHPVYQNIILGRPFEECGELICEGPFPGLDGHFIVSGWSPRFDCFHAVVWGFDGTAHDPHPLGSGVEPFSVNLIYRPEEWPVKPKYRYEE